MTARISQQQLESYLWGAAVLLRVKTAAGFRHLSISAIRGGVVVPEGSLKYANVEPEDVAQFKPCKDDILVVHGNGNRLLCGRTGIVKDFPEDWNTKAVS